MIPSRDMVELVEPLIPALRRYARALMRDPDTADDLVQDGLERAMTRWTQRRREQSTRAWMFTILHNLAINRLRTRKAAFVPLEDAPEARLAQAPDQEAAMHRRDIVGALEQLPEDQRHLLLLISLEGVSYAEAAAITGVPIGTVMSRLARGRERLRRLLEETVDPVRPSLRIVK